MAGGRPEFEMVVAQAPRKSLAIANLSIALTNIGANGTLTQQIIPPSDYIGKIVGIDFNIKAPSGATSGNHFVYWGYPAYGIIKGQSSYNQDLVWKYSHWDTAQTYFPSQNPDSQMTRIEFDKNNPFQVVYANQTNLGQTNALNLNVIYLLEQISG